MRACATIADKGSVELLSMLWVERSHEWATRVCWLSFVLVCLLLQGIPWWGWSCEITAVLSLIKPSISLASFFFFFWDIMTTALWYFSWKLHYSGNAIWALPLNLSVLTFWARYSSLRDHYGKAFKVAWKLWYLLTRSFMIKLRKGFVDYLTGLYIFSNSRSYVANYT